MAVASTLLSSATTSCSAEVSSSTASAEKPNKQHHDLQELQQKISKMEVEHQKSSSSADKMIQVVNREQHQTAPGPQSTTATTTVSKQNKKEWKKKQKDLQGRLNEACRKRNVADGLDNKRNQRQHSWTEIQAVYEDWMENNPDVPKPSCLFAQTMQGVVEEIVLMVDNFSSSSSSSCMTKTNQQQQAEEVTKIAFFIQKVFEEAKKHFFASNPNANAGNSNLKNLESLLYLLFRSYCAEMKIRKMMMMNFPVAGEEETSSSAAGRVSSSEQVSLIDNALEQFMTYFGTSTNKSCNTETEREPTSHATSDTSKKATTMKPVHQVKLRTLIPIFEMFALSGGFSVGDSSRTTTTLHQEAPSAPSSTTSAAHDTSKNTRNYFAEAELFYEQQVAKRFLQHQDPTASGSSTTTSTGPSGYMNTASIIMHSVTRNSSVQINDDQKNWEWLFLFRIETLLNSKADENKLEKLQTLLAEMAKVCPRLGLVKADEEVTSDNTTIHLDRGMGAATTGTNVTVKSKLLDLLRKFNYRILTDKSIISDETGICDSTNLKLQRKNLVSKGELEKLLRLIERLATEQQQQTSFAGFSTPSSSPAPSVVSEQNGAAGEKKVGAAVVPGSVVPPPPAAATDTSRVRSSNCSEEAPGAGPRNSSHNSLTLLERWQLFRYAVLEKQFLHEGANDQYDCVLDGANIGHHSQNHDRGAFSLEQIDLAMEECKKLGRKPLVILREHWCRDRAKILLKAEHERTTTTASNIKLLDDKGHKAAKRRKLAPLGADNINTTSGMKMCHPLSRDQGSSVSSRDSGSAADNLGRLDSSDVVPRQASSSSVSSSFKSSEDLVRSSPEGGTPRSEGNQEMQEENRTREEDLPATANGTAVLDQENLNCDKKNIQHPTAAYLQSLQNRKRPLDLDSWHELPRKWYENKELLISPNKLNDDWVFLYTAIKICALKKTSHEREIKINSMTNINSPKETTPPKELYLISNDLMRDHFFRMRHHPSLLQWRDQHLCKFNVSGKVLVLHHQEQKRTGSAIQTAGESSEIKIPAEEVGAETVREKDEVLKVVESKIVADYSSAVVELITPKNWSAEIQRIDKATAQEEDKDHQQDHEENKTRDYDCNKRGHCWFFPFLPSSQVTVSQDPRLRAASNNNAGGSSSCAGGHLQQSGERQNKEFSVKDWRWVVAEYAGGGENEKGNGSSDVERASARKNETLDGN
ncbi:unnamed protein product [Amoebophrya sp. A120]|nr:unnamed protein product [Amoebophrya sp. A120]|eukprot:GSA120T00024522001.1